ncbi:MAG: 4a-hydroxytetrahydrobiopterin dehydratase [Pyrinomonadaceae bacterium]|nr:4a-hydroxytetrahydrobiopterin dehydratase [Pyrinomonadaceae bacterium]
MDKLSEAEVAAHAEKLEEWEIDDSFLIKGWEFEDFTQAFEFVNKIAALAEAESHHPDISFGYGYVEVALTTHDVEGLTAQDFEIATKIDSL